MLLAHLFQALRFCLCAGAPALLGHFLVGRMGPWTALAVAALVACATTTTGALLLRTTAVGRITWKNHMGGWLLPWGYTIARGRLFVIALVSCLVFVSLAGAGILAGTLGQAPTNAPAAAPATASVPTGTPWLLVLAWIVDGTCLMYLLGTLAGSTPGSSSGRTLRKLVLTLVAMLVGSTALALFGHHGLATAVAGGPPLVLGTAYGLFVLVLLLAGRGARWN